jgi:hypothetical protein
MAINKARGQSESNQRLLFKIGDGASLTEVSPLGAAADCSIVDTGNGDYSVTVKAFKGPRGLVNVQLTSVTISTFASCASASYSGDDLTFVVKIENDASSATNGDVYVAVEAF